jgi:hypothetical protein
MSKTAIADAVAEAQRKAKIAINAAKAASAHHAARAAAEAPAAEAPAAEAPGAGAGTAGPGNSSSFFLSSMFPGSKEKANNHKCSTCGQPRRESAPAVILSSAAAPAGRPPRSSLNGIKSVATSAVSSLGSAATSLGSAAARLVSRVHTNVNLSKPAYTSLTLKQKIPIAITKLSKEHQTPRIRDIIDILTTFQSSSLYTSADEISKEGATQLLKNLGLDGANATKTYLQTGDKWLGDHLLPYIRVLIKKAGGYSTRSNKKSKKSLTRKRH